MNIMPRRVSWLFALVLLLAGPVPAQQAAPPAEVQPPSAFDARFFATADEVMQQVSKLLGLPVKAPLKKSIRSREEIREYLLKQFREDKEPLKRRADQLALERFGLLPRGFDLNAFLVELLTEQIAGLYDPKAGEFYIADWLDIFTQRMVMAHELVHALHDQHFRVDAWIDAAKPNDDAQLARQAVLEGAATAAMLDYLLRDSDKRVRTMPDFAPFVSNLMGSNLSAAGPQMAKAPPFLQDALLFPYLSGAIFTQRVLQAGPGWREFAIVFEKPPVSTQQILHPELYLQGVTPHIVVLPDLTRTLGPGWKRLDENLMGEFGVYSLLKQMLDEPRAKALSPQWAGDRYAIYERAASKKTVLAFRIRFRTAEAAARFLGQYGELLEKKYQQRENLFRRPGFFSFESEHGGVFLQCEELECVTLEGAARGAFDQMVRAMHWNIPPRPVPPPRPAKTAQGLPPPYAHPLPGWPASPAARLQPAP
jgi:hypothetical protein